MKRSGPPIWMWVLVVVLGLIIIGLVILLFWSPSQTATPTQPTAASDTMGTASASTVAIESVRLPHTFAASPTGPGRGIVAQTQAWPVKSRVQHVEEAANYGDEDGWIMADAGA
ncbi:MAG: hypothetical protein U0822_23245 [Anaerolineae bacterium]